MLQLSQLAIGGIPMGWWGGDDEAEDDEICNCFVPFYNEIRLKCISCKLTSPHRNSRGNIALHTHSMATFRIAGKWTWWLSNFILSSVDEVMLMEISAWRINRIPHCKGRKGGNRVSIINYTRSELSASPQLLHTSTNLIIIFRVFPPFEMRICTQDGH